MSWTVWVTPGTTHHTRTPTVPHTPSPPSVPTMDLHGKREEHSITLCLWCGARMYVQINLWGLVKVRITQSPSVWPRAGPGSTQKESYHRPPTGASTPLPCVKYRAGSWVCDLCSPTQTQKGSSVVSCSAITLLNLSITFKESGLGFPFPLGLKLMWAV